MVINSIMFVLLPEYLVVQKENTNTNTNATTNIFFFKVMRKQSVADKFNDFCITPRVPGSTNTNTNTNIIFFFKYLRK